MLAVVPNVAHHVHIISLLTSFLHQEEEEEMVVALLQANSCLSHTTLYYLRTPGYISSCNCGDQNRYLKPNHKVSLSLTKWFLSLHLTRA